MGILTLLPAILLWINHCYTLAISIATFGIHAIVLVLLLTVFRDEVARQSLAAMIFRLAIWVAILALLFFRS